MFNKTIHPLLIISIFLVSVLPATPMRIIDALRSDVNSGMYSCEGLGDINNDGYADFLLGEFVSNELLLYLGGPHPFDNPPALVWFNHGTKGGLEPFTPVNVGDVDCDGVDDFISAFDNNDTLKLFLGLERLECEDYLIMYAGSLASWDGIHISGGKDNNNDGRPDLWIHKDKIYDTLFGYSGCDLLDTAYDFMIIPSIAPDNKYVFLGRELCSTCDINGDSVPEIIYGQPTSYPGYPGRVCIIWGNDVLSEIPDVMFYAPYTQSGDYEFGIDLACLNDINGDGIDDIWVNQGGRNYIYFGGRPFDTIPDLALDWAYMYSDMENIGDINNDGWSDVGLFRDDYLINVTSFIYCYPDMDTLVDVVYSDDDFYFTVNDGPVCCLGYDHSRCGDVDGDGVDDLLVTGGTTGTSGYAKGWAIIMAGWDGDPVDVGDDEENIARLSYSLAQNHPNPFNSSTTIKFHLPWSSHVELRIYNLLGEVIAQPLNNQLTAGTHQIRWDGLDSTGQPSPSGIYLYRLLADNYSETKKMVLIK